MAPTTQSAYATFVLTKPPAPSRRNSVAWRVCTCKQPGPEPTSGNAVRRAGETMAVAVATAALVGALAADAAMTMKLPPIDTSNRNRCVPTSSSIGQANAARDTVLDLRECDLRKLDLTSYDLSGGLLANANMEGVKLVNAQLSKAYAPGAVFRGVDFTNGIIDRVNFNGADLSGAIFANAVLSDSTFEEANVENVDFTDVYIGDFAQRNICRNPTAKGENPVTGALTRQSLGCK